MGSLGFGLFHLDHGFSFLEFAATGLLTFNLLMLYLAKYFL